MLKLLNLFNELKTLTPNKHRYIGNKNIISAIANVKNYYRSDSSVPVIPLQAITRLVSDEKRPHLLIHSTSGNAIPFRHILVQNVQGNVANQKTIDKYVQN